MRISGIRKKMEALKGVRLRDNVRVEDKRAVADILSASGLFYPYEIDVAIELLDDFLDKGRQSEYRFLFADIGGGAAGYACFGPISMSPGRFDLYWIAVDKKHQRKGIGGLLLSGAEKKMAAEGAGYIYVETSSREVYLPTRRFYEKHGYRQVACVPEYFGDGDHKIIYMNSIKKSLDTFLGSYKI